MTVQRCQPEAAALRQHTPTPWFMSGVRFRMNGSEWHSINRYDESTKKDENIACVGYDPRTGLGLADAHFIVEAVNSHATLQARIEELTRALEEIASGDWGYVSPNPGLDQSRIKDNYEPGKNVPYMGQWAVVARRALAIPLEDK